MGLFSFVGKALKGISKVAGFIPGIGGTISKVAGTVGNLLDHKAPMSTTASKLSAISRMGGAGGATGVVYMRGNTPQWGGSLMQPQVLRASPVLPGGAIATASGPAPRAAAPPRTYGGKRATTTRRKATKRAPRKKARRLKFGSAAYRKKYLKHRR